MRILQLISSAGPYGAENLLVELSCALEKLGSQLTVLVIENRAPRSLDVLKRAQERGLNAEFLPHVSRIDLHTVGKINEFIVTNGIEVVHAHGYKSNLYGLLSARRTHAGTVTTCHGWPGKSPAVRAYYMLDKLAIRYFDHVVAVSNSIETTLQRWGVSRKKITYVSNGVDTIRFCEPFTNRSLATCCSDRIRIGVVARLSPEKGIPVMFHAMKTVLQEFPRTELCLIGDGPDRNRLEDLAVEMGIHSHISFWGMQTDMPDVYSKIDIFVLPSLSENLPMALLEAMACGKPLVATTVGNIPQVVTHNKSGILVEPGDVIGLADAILRYIRQPNISEEFGHAAAERVKAEHSSDRMAEKYLHIYQSVVASRDSSASISREAKNDD